MKKMSKNEIGRIAYDIGRIWLCQYGLRNADKLSKAVRKQIIEEMRK